MVRVMLILIVLISFLTVPNTYAQDLLDYKEEFFRGKVLEIVDQGSIKAGDVENPYQIVKVELYRDGKSETLEIDHGRTLSISQDQLVKKEDKVVISKVSTGDSQETYLIRDKYRIDGFYTVFAIFIAFVILISGFRGVGSILGLGVSLIVILAYIVPRIIAGANPVFAIVTGSMAIMFFTIYLAHGFSRRTTSALISTFISLLLAAGFSFLFVGIAKLSGFGNEGAYSLSFGQTAGINLKGLLLGGMIIGTLGILDDVTITQSATVFELFGANNKLKFASLVKKGLVVGREHVASVVNTLVLAYAGSSMAVFIFFLINPLNTPVWVILNSEFVMEEVIRALAGSVGLILAVPISTVIASYFAVKTK